MNRNNYKTINNYSHPENQLQPRTRIVEKFAEAPVDCKGEFVFDCVADPYATQKIYKITSNAKNGGKSCPNKPGDKFTGTLGKTEVMCLAKNIKDYLIDLAKMNVELPSYAFNKYSIYLRDDPKFLNDFYKLNPKYVEQRNKITRAVSDKVKQFFTTDVRNPILINNIASSLFTDPSIKIFQPVLVDDIMNYLQIPTGENVKYYQPNPKNDPKITKQNDYNIKMTKVYPL
jgi:hypothetical protein